MDHGAGFVPVPFEVSTHPEDAPAIHRSNERCFRHGRLHLFGVVLPVRANLEDFNALPFHAIANIELIPNILGRPATLKKMRECLLASSAFDLGKCHRARLRVGVNVGSHRRRRRPRGMTRSTASYATSAWNLTPRAFAPFRTVAKVGLPFSPSALYKLSRLSPESRAT